MLTEFCGQLFLYVCSHLPDLAPFYFYSNSVDCIKIQALRYRDGDIGVSAEERKNIRL